jgi:HPr kinase/phosphorylase
MTARRRPLVGLHASACLVGEAGVLVRGPSGSGKSLFVHRLLAAAAGRGLFSALVADDRVTLSLHADRLVARPVPPLGGLLELRGVGIARLPAEAAAVIRLVVDLEDGPRLPEEADRRTELLGISVERLVLPGPENADLALWHLCGGNDTLMTTG